MQKSLALLLILCALLSLLTACQSSYSQPTDGYDIEVFVEGLKRKEAFLGHYVGNETRIVDTTQVKDGKFSFRGDSLLPVGLYLIIFPPSNDYLEIILAEDQQFSLKTDIRQPVAYMEVQNSLENELFYKDLNIVDEFRKNVSNLETQLQGRLSQAEKDSIRSEIDAEKEKLSDYKTSIPDQYPDLFFTQIFQAVQPVDIPRQVVEEDPSKKEDIIRSYTKAHYFDKIDLGDERLLFTPLIYRKVATYLGRFTDHSHADSVISSLDFILDKAKGNEEIFSYLVEVFLGQYQQFRLPTPRRDSILAFVLEKELEVMDKPRPTFIDPKRITDIRVGSPAPDFMAGGMEGDFFKMSEIEASKTVVYFWDYACEECQKSTPKLARQFRENALAEKGIRLMTINMNGDPQEWKTVLEDFGLDQEGIINTQDIHRKFGGEALYQVRLYPSIFLLDDKKRVLDHSLSGEELMERLLQN